MSARPPLLENGCTSLLARRIFIRNTLLAKAARPPWCYCDGRVRNPSDVQFAPPGQLAGSRGDAFGLEASLQRGWNLETAIGLLARFHQRHEEPGQRGAAAVEDVRELVVAAFAFEAQIHPARLKLLAIRATRHLQVLPLPRPPSLP